MQLELQNIKYVSKKGKWPQLVMTINDKKVIIEEPKLALLKLGYVWLGPEDEKFWEENLDPITVEVEKGNVKTFKGFTAQADIVKAVKDWVNKMNGEDFL